MMPSVGVVKRWSNVSTFLSPLTSVTSLKSPSLSRDTRRIEWRPDIRMYSSAAMRGGGNKVNEYTS